jgi:hypothetical protein
MRRVRVECAVYERERPNRVVAQSYIATSFYRLRLEPIEVKQMKKRRKKLPVSVFWVRANCHGDPAAALVAFYLRRVCGTVRRISKSPTKEYAAFNSKSQFLGHASSMRSVKQLVEDAWHEDGRRLYGK